MAAPDRAMLGRESGCWVSESRNLGDWTAPCTAHLQLEQQTWRCREGLRAFRGEQAEFGEKGCRKRVGGQGGLLLWSPASTEKPEKQALLPRAVWRRGTVLHTLSRRDRQVMIPRGPDRASFQSHPPVRDLLQNNQRVVIWSKVTPDLL